MNDNVGGGNRTGFSEQMALTGETKWVGWRRFQAAAAPGMARGRSLLQSGAVYVVGAWVNKDIGN